MNDQEFSELECLLKINQHDLDGALLEQPEAFYRISQAYVQAVSMRDKLYEDVKVVDASLDLAIREEFEQEGKKATEKIIESKVKSHPNHDRAYRSYLSAKEEAERLNALKESFLQRSYVLKELCNIYISGYSVAESSIKSETQKTRSDIKKAISEKKEVYKRALKK